MEHPQKTEAIDADVEKTSQHVDSDTGVSGGNGPMTPPNSATADATSPVLVALPMPTTPETTASQPRQTKKQQQKENLQKTPKTPKTPQKRRATVSHVSSTGAGKKQGPASPRTRNAKATQGTSTASGSSGSQRSFPGSPRSSRDHKRSATESRTFDQIQAEHLYLYSNLQQQEARIRTLVAALATVQAQLQLPSTPAEARRLRKNAGFIKSKIADAEQQERLALLGIGHVSAELQSRYRHLQLHQHLHHQQMHIMAHAPTQVQAHRVQEDDAQLHHPPTPYLVPHPGPVYVSPESQGQGQVQNTGFVASTLAHGLATASTSTTAVFPAAAGPESWQHSRHGGEADFMSPMSPLAPVFQPGASFFFGHASTSGSIDAVFASANADNADAVADDATAKQESLGGTTFAGDAEERSEDKSVDIRDETSDEKIAAVTPRSVPDEDDAAAVQNNSSTATDAGMAGMHYIFDAHGNGSDCGDGDSDDSDEFAPRDIRLRRGSHDGQQRQQQPLTPARKKRMSLPPVQFTWPEKRD